MLVLVLFEPRYCESGLLLDVVCLLMEDGIELVEADGFVREGMEICDAAVFRVEVALRLALARVGCMCDAMFESRLLFVLVLPRTEMDSVLSGLSMNRDFVNFGCETGGAEVFAGWRGGLCS